MMDNTLKASQNQITILLDTLKAKEAAWKIKDDSTKKVRVAEEKLLWEKDKVENLQSAVQKRTQPVKSTLPNMARPCPKCKKLMSIKYLKNHMETTHQGAALPSFLTKYIYTSI